MKSAYSETEITQAMFEARTVTDLTEYIERLVPVHPEVGTHSLAPTGEPYITFSIGGPVEELERPDLVATREAAACRWFLDSFLRYAIGKVGKLYWREKPNLTVQDVVPLDARGNKLPDDRRRYFQVWARLLVSDKPLLEETYDTGNRSRKNRSLR